MIPEQKIMHGRELTFISFIKRDGSGTTTVEPHPETLENDRFVLTRLSITQGTWIASGFNSYVVKINP
jgi:hypothetical protein